MVSHTFNDTNYLLYCIVNLILFLSLATTYPQIIYHLRLLFGKNMFLGLIMAYFLYIQSLREIPHQRSLDIIKGLTLPYMVLMKLLETFLAVA